MPAAATAGSPPVIGTPVPLRLFIQAAELALRLGAIEEVRAAAHHLLLAHPHALIAQLLLGQSFVEDEQPRLALPHFARIVAHHPLDPAAWIGLALSHAARGEEQSAQLALLRSRELAPLDGLDDPLEQEELLPLAHALLALRASQIELAVLTLRRIRQMEPERHELAILEAEGLRRLGERREAVALMAHLAAEARSTLPALLVRAALAGEQRGVEKLLRTIAALDLDGRFAAQFFAPDPCPLRLPQLPPITWPDRAGMLPELAQSIEEAGLTEGGGAVAPARAAPFKNREIEEDAAGCSADGERVMQAKFSPSQWSKPSNDPAVAELAATIERRRSLLLGRVGVRPLQPWPVAERTVQLLVTSRQGLLRKYGEAGCEAVVQRLSQLAAALHDRAVPTELCIVDDPESLRAFAGLAPVPHEATEVAGLIMRAERRIADSGRSMRMVLLVGGDEVLPFHRLPNESEDSDGPTLSDLPYGGGDSTQVLPRWAVARVPDGAGSDARYLLHLLDQMIDYHRGWQQPVAAGGCLMPSLSRLQHSKGERSYKAVGLSAQVWREASEAIYGPLESDRPLLLSPPEDITTFDQVWLRGRRLLYFNLHGAHASPNWYGEAPFDAPEGPQLPIALTPAALAGTGLEGAIVLSEACYGAEIAGRKPGEAIALTMLLEGALAFVGSTVTAYGAPGPPLAAADLFISELCQRIAAGEPVGLAFHAARDDFIRAIYGQHGFMDGDDLKTLQSFVLYGDPWASLAAQPASPVTPKSPAVLPFLARERHAVGESQLPHDLLLAIRQRLSKLLPGGLGKMTLAVEPLRQTGAKGHGERQALFVNAEQQLSTQDGRVVTRVAHLTLLRARLVKAVVSR